MTENEETVTTTTQDGIKITSFEQLGLREGILRGLKKAGYVTPTAIQAQVIDRFVHGNHIVGQSQTGTGKTAAFVIPLINAIDPRSRKLQAIVMAPTRELVVQTEEEFYKLAWGSPGFKSAAAYGGGSKYRQLSQLERGAQVLVATPGRLLDYISTGKISTADVKYFVLDEADRMLDMGFQDDIEDIMNACPAVEQVMSFSATITPELNRIITRYIGNEYDFIKTTTEVVVDKIDHSFVHVKTIDKMDMLDKYLKQHQNQKVIIFTQTKIGADDVAKQLYHMGHKVAAIHGDIDQRSRMRIIKDLKSDYLKILVATDIAARGLNLNDVELVINYEVPQDPEAYVHRIGRTARAGKSGKAITFADSREFESLKLIEKRSKVLIKQVDHDGNILEKRIIDTVRAATMPHGRRGRSRFGGNRTGRFDDRGGSRFGGYGGGGSHFGRGHGPFRHGDHRLSSDRQGFSGQSRSGSKGGNGSSRDGNRGYRYNDSQEAGARSGEYSAPRKDNEMFVPRNKYY